MTNKVEEMERQQSAPQSLLFNGKRIKTDDEDTVYAKTTDFDLFHKIEGNRKIKPAHVANLVSAFDADPNIAKYNPIIVNEEYGIIDGQHRYEALKKLGLPVYFIKENYLTLDDVIALNSGQKAWTPQDFAESWIERGRMEYQTYLDFKSEYGLNHDVLLRYLALDKPMTTTMYKAGKFVPTDVEKSRELCNDLVSLKPYYNRWNNRAFALGFYYLWKNPQYKHKRMLDKVSRYSDRVSDRGTPEQYADMLSEIYNFGVQEQNRVWFAR